MVFITEMDQRLEVNCEFCPKTMVRKWASNVEKSLHNAE